MSELQSAYKRKNSKKTKDENVRRQQEKKKDNSKQNFNT
jgi:hypothetical protein